MFLDFEPEAKTSHRFSGLPFTELNKNATMNKAAAQGSNMFLSFLPSA
jgi:hypothetical protein